MVRRRWPEDRVFYAVIALAVGALSIRLFALGQRIAHWDEGRVAYWVLRYAETGTWTYRPIVHGPFLKHTTRLVFETLGPTDATMRLVVALVGGLLPLAALAFRSPTGERETWRLDDAETVALALLLAANPILVYFSRFLRNDVVLAAFAVASLGFLVRAVETDGGRDVLASVAFLALAFTTKENVVLYLLSWLGAATLVAATAVWRGREETPPRAFVRRGVRAVGRRAWAWRAPLLAGVGVFGVIVVFFYAPRAGGRGGVGLWAALAGRGSLAVVVGEATLGSAGSVADVWLSGTTRTHAYGPYLLHYAVVLLVGAAPLVAFAVVGLLDDRRRSLVAFGGWWGLSAVVGYPLATDVKAPWLTVHAVVALAFPAAVGLAAVARRVRAAAATGDRRVAAIFGGLLVVAAAHVGVVAVATSYTYPMPDANIVAQSAQPGSDLRPVLDRIETISRTHDDGPDVLYYGDLAVAEESVDDDPPAAASWYERLPLPWYTERANATVTSARTPETFPANPPPVVIVRPRQEAAIADELDGYRRYERAIFLLPDDRTVSILGYERRFGGRSLVFYVERDGATDAGSDGTGYGRGIG
ncbi:MAG: flippase activity-associated protein Agl23 [Haloarculaceae archaeon]